MTRRRPSTGLLAVALLVLSGCGQARHEPCTQADLDRAAPVELPEPVAVTRARDLNGDRIEPLPAGFTPAVSARRASRRLAQVRPRQGGGDDELLLGLFTGRGFHRVPAFVLFTSHVAQRLDPLPAQTGVKPRAAADVCAFVDMLTVLDATTGERFYGSTITSSGRRVLPPTTTGPTPGSTIPPPASPTGDDRL